MRLALALFLCRALMQSQLKGLSQAVAVYNVVAVGARVGREVERLACV